MTTIIWIDGEPAPNSNLPTLPQAYIPYASDTFTGSDLADINGRLIDNGLGGNTTLAWISSPANTYAISGGKMVRGSANSGLGGAALNVGNSAMRMTAHLNALSSSNLFLDMRKTVANGSATFSDGYRLRITSAGVVTVEKKPVGVSSTTISTKSHVVKAGDKLSLEVNGTQLRLFINLIEVEVMTDTTPLTGNYFEIYQGGSASLSLNSINFQNL